jgi:hypothetical protein
VKRDLRKQLVEDVLSHVENSLHLRLDPQTLVRKRRSLGARTNRGTWVRIEARPLAKIAAQGQAGDGIEAAARLYGIAKPEWFNAVSWHDSPGQTVWRADEVELVTAAPVRSSGPLGSDVELSDEWWGTLNASLDSLTRQHTVRVATPDTETITQALVTTEINRAFPDQVDAIITDHEWVPAHADLNWANLTSPRMLDTRLGRSRSRSPRAGRRNPVDQLPDRPDTCREGLSRATDGSGNALGKAHGAGLGQRVTRGGQLTAAFAGW